MWLFTLPTGEQFSVQANSKDVAIRLLQAEMNRRGISMRDPRVMAALDQGSRVPSTNIPETAIVIRDTADTTEPVEPPPVVDPNVSSPVATPEPIRDPAAGSVTLQGAENTAQSLPFSTFANTLMGRGLNPDGVFGSALSQQFAPLEQARTIGQFTGSVGPIGRDAGALREFFESNLGNSGLASQIFNDLRSGRTMSGLSDENGTFLAGLRAPDLTDPSGAGRSNANRVFDLARQAARDRFGLAADLLGGSNTALQDQFGRHLVNTVPGQAAPDFLSFVGSRFGI